MLKDHRRAAAKAVDAARRFDAVPDEFEVDGQAEWVNERIDTFEPKVPDDISQAVSDPDLQAQIDNKIQELTQINNELSRKKRILGIDIDISADEINERYNRMLYNKAMNPDAPYTDMVPSDIYEQVNLHFAGDNAAIDRAIKNVVENIPPRTVITSIGKEIIEQVYLHATSLGNLDDFGSVDLSELRKSVKEDRLADLLTLQNLEGETLYGYKFEQGKVFKNGQEIIDPDYDDIFENIYDQADMDADVETSRRLLNAQEDAINRVQASSARTSSEVPLDTDKVVEAASNPRNSMQTTVPSRRSSGIPLDAEIEIPGKANLQTGRSLNNIDPSDLPDTFRNSNPSRTNLLTRARSSLGNFGNRLNPRNLGNRVQNSFNAFKARGWKGNRNAAFKGTLKGLAKPIDFMFDGGATKMANAKSLKGAGKAFMKTFAFSAGMEVAMVLVEKAISAKVCADQCQAKKDDFCPGGEGSVEGVCRNEVCMDYPETCDGKNLYDNVCQTRDKCVTSCKEKVIKYCDVDKCIKDDCPFCDKECQHDMALNAATGGMFGNIQMFYDMTVGNIAKNQDRWVCGEGGHNPVDPGMGDIARRACEFDKRGGGEGSLSSDPDKWQHDEDKNCDVTAETCRERREDIEKNQSTTAAKYISNFQAGSKVLACAASTGPSGRFDAQGNEIIATYDKNNACHICVAKPTIVTVQKQYTRDQSPTGEILSVPIPRKTMIYTFRDISTEKTEIKENCSAAFGYTYEAPCLPGWKYIPNGCAGIECEPCPPGESSDGAYSETCFPCDGHSRVPTRRDPITNILCYEEISNECQTCPENAYRISKTNPLTEFVPLFDTTCGDYNSPTYAEYITTTKKMVESFDECQMQCFSRDTCEAFEYGLNNTNVDYFNANGTIDTDTDHSLTATRTSYERFKDLQTLRKTIDDNTRATYATEDDIRAAMENEFTSGSKTHTCLMFAYEYKIDFFLQGLSGRTCYRKQIPFDREFDPQYEPIDVNISMCATHVAPGTQVKQDDLELCPRGTYNPTQTTSITTAGTTRRIALKCEKGCKVCDSSSCIEWKDGWSYGRKCLEGCRKCNPDTLECLEAMLTYKLEDILSSCRPGCHECNANTCLTAQPGYGLNATSNVRCAEGCKSCKDPSICDTFYEGWYNDTNVPVKCKEACKTCEDGNDCIEYKPGWNLTGIISTECDFGMGKNGDCTQAFDWYNSSSKNIINTMW